MTRINKMSALPLQVYKQDKPQNIQQTCFKDLLADIKNNQVKISKHAQLRLIDRNIHISQEKWITIGEKLKEARTKGVNDSLILLNNAALIVSAKNNTVVTAMNLDEAKEQIFTNINGTIILD